MNLDDIVQDIHVLEQDLQTFERKYGVLSETFYESYMKGEEPEDDSWVKDWAAWAGAVEAFKKPYTPPWPCHSRVIARVSITSGRSWATWVML